MTLKHAAPAHVYHHAPIYSGSDSAKALSFAQAVEGIRPRRVHYSSHHSKNDTTRVSFVAPDRTIHLLDLPYRGGLLCDHGWAAPIIAAAEAREVDLVPGNVIAATHQGTEQEYVAHTFVGRHATGREGLYGVTGLGPTVFQNWLKAVKGEGPDHVTVELGRVPGRSFENILLIGKTERGDMYLARDPFTGRSQEKVEDIKKEGFANVIDDLPSLSGIARIVNEMRF